MKDVVKDSGKVPETFSPRLGRDGIGRDGLGSRTATQSSAAARSYEGDLDGRCAAEVWSWYSPYPREAGIAGRRFTTYAPMLANVPLLYAIGEAAVEGHHAAGSLIEPYLRGRIARINEELRKMQKAEELDESRQVRRGMRSMGDILAGLYKQDHPSRRGT